MARSSFEKTSAPRSSRAETGRHTAGARMLLLSRERGHLKLHSFESGKSRSDAKLRSARQKSKFFVFRRGDHRVLRTRQSIFTGFALVSSPRCEVGLLAPLAVLPRRGENSPGSARKWGKGNRGRGCLPPLFHSEF